MDLELNFLSWPYILICFIFSLSFLFFFHHRVCNLRDKSMYSSQGCPYYPTLRSEKRLGGSYKSRYYKKFKSLVEFTLIGRCDSRCPLSRPFHNDSKIKEAVIDVWFQNTFPYKLALWDTQEGYPQHRRNERWPKAGFIHDEKSKVTGFLKKSANLFKPSCLIERASFCFGFVTGAWTRLRRENHPSNPPLSFRVNGWDTGSWSSSAVAEFHLHWHVCWRNSSLRIDTTSYKKCSDMWE